MAKHSDFYSGTLSVLLREGKIELSSEILVVCGGYTDAEVLKELGFTRVTLANLDVFGGNPFEPYALSYQHAEHLSFPGQSFDFVIVHSGLHHLRSPFQAIYEMYRVARKGILGFEPYASLYTDLGVRLGFGQEYETAAVLAGNCVSGGVDEGPIPNYVVRFSKADIQRCVDTLNPVARHRMRFWTALRIPGGLHESRNPLIRWSIALLGPVLQWLGENFSGFANNLAFYVEKPHLPADLHPWLMMDGDAIALRRSYFEKKYRCGPEPTDQE